MRRIDRIDLLNRRGFMEGCGGAAALVALTSLVPVKAYASVTLKTAPPSALATLVRMARDLYPHDRLEDAAYEIAVGRIDENMASAPATATALGEGVMALDAAAIEMKGVPYVAIEDESDRVAVLQAIEGGAFFQLMRSNMVVALYNQPDLWEKFGYEGPSANEGGYLYRGFNDLDWLPA